MGAFSCLIAELDLETEKMKTILQQVVLKDVKKLASLSGGQCFVFWDTDSNLHELIENGEVFVFVKDSTNNGSCKVLNLTDGLLIQRDSDRKVVVLDSTLTLAITESPKI